MPWLSRITSWYFSKRALPYWGTLLLDSLIIVISSVFAIYLTLGGDAVISLFWQKFFVLLLMLPCYWIGMRVFHTYAGIIRYSSFVDLMRVSLALLIGIVINFFASFLLPESIHAFEIDIRVFLSIFFLAMIGMWSFRICVKYSFDFIVRDNATSRIFIYGVREGGVSIAKSIRNQNPLPYLIKGFVSDDPHDVGRFLLGTHVKSASLATVEYMKKEDVRHIFISPNCNEKFRENQSFIDALMKAGITIMMLPAAETWDGKSSLQHTRLHEVDIEDLLPRDKIQVDMKAIADMLKGKRILITGAAGSIGSEMVRQVAKFSPSELILVDQAETPMHDVRLYMQNNYPDLKCWTVVGSISNPTQMEAIFKEHRPEYVFHAAAYKHVPMMEDNPAMAVQNNVYGTRVIADLAVRYGTRKFVMISTDKAVNPTNVMGCSKRICEIYCQSLNAEVLNEGSGSSIGSKGSSGLRQFDGSLPCTQFITTRFGNVLGSNGSVIPIFREQIRKGGPVTVTHRDIIRFFMLIPEACQLVLEAGTMGHGGEIFVFDMGKPVRIADLAQRMIDLSGAKGIEIKYTGLRDGEKLYEEVLNDAEQTKPTVHPKIKVAAVREYPYDQALRNEEELYQLSFGYDDMAIVRKMKDIVPEYRSQHSKYEVLDK